jgi:hypothetical protein
VLPARRGPQRGSAPAILERIWSVAIDPVSDVVAVDEVAILYSTSANGLLLHGFDAASGVERWRHAAAPAPGEFAHADVHGGTLTYFRAHADRALSHVVLADPATGVDLAVTDARQ